jgi:hypothetical protein
MRERSAYRVSVGKPEGKPRRSGKMILKWILKEWFRRAWTGLIWLRIGTYCGLL